MKIKLSSGSSWNYRKAIIYWIAVFMGLGPIQLLFNSNQYEGSVIFNNDPYAYFILFGITAASLSLGLMYLFVWIWNRYSSSRSL